MTTSFKWYISLDLSHEPKIYHEHLIYGVRTLKMYSQKINLEFNCYVWELILSDIAHSQAYHGIHKYGLAL